MKYRVIVFFLLLLTNLSMADSSIHKQSVGKPRVDAFFMDTDVIRIIPGQLHSIDIKIHYSAETIDYVIYSSDGLLLKELAQASQKDAAEGALIIPVQMSVSQQGRFYIHVQLTTKKDGIETKGVISKIVSSEEIDSVQGMKKQLQSNNLQILPSTETIKTKADE
jgi:hypothetical protein